MAFDVTKIGVKKNVPKVSFMEYSGLFVGPAKFGKTTLASMMPKAITCAFEVGYRGQVMDVKDMETWEDFIDFVDDLERYRKEIGDDIRIVAIDTVNKAWDKCGEYTLKRVGKLLGKKCSRPQDIPHGQFYPERDKDFAQQLDRLTMLGFVPFFTTHSKVKTITPEEGESYDVYTTTMEDRCANIVMPFVDYILYGKRSIVEDEMGNQKATRVLTSKGEISVTAGNRVYFDDDIYFDSEDEAVVKFQECFSKVIAERLKKAGITEDIKEIEQRQRQEKLKEVDKYIEKSKEKTNSELVDMIKSKFTENKGKQVEYTRIMADLGITSLANPDELDVAKLQELLQKM